MRFLKKLFGRQKAEPTSAQDEFAALVLDALRHLDPSLAVEYLPDRFEFLLPSGQKTFLANSFIEYGRLKERERPMHVHRVASFILDSQKPMPQGDEALDALLPVLRARADMIAATSDMGAWPYRRSSRPFCDTMLMMLAVDTERAIALVTDEALDRMGISFDEALAIAIGHLNDRDNHQFGQIGDGTFVINCGDFYESGRILIPGLIENLPVKGDPVAIVQARSAVVVTGSDDMAGLELIANCVWEDFPQNERAVSLTPIVLKDGEWSPFPIAPHHPQALKNLIPSQAQWAYDATREALQNMVGDDLFVASPIVFRNEDDDRIATFASWATDVPTACPLTDAVILQADGDFPEIIRRFEDVVEVCGPFEPVAVMPYPARLKMPGRPDAAQRRALTDNYPKYEPFGS